MQSNCRHDFVTLCAYGDLLRLVYHKTPVFNGDYKATPVHHDEKLDNSLVRSRSTVRELALCNSWEHFVTLTLSPDKYDRYHLPQYRKDLSQFIRNYNRLHDCSIKYLLIPEQHKDGAWHMHGLFMGLPSEALCTNCHGYLDWQGYSDRFGFCSLDPVRSLERVSTYISKYISKDLAVRKKELGAHLYYASQKLNRAELIFEGSLRNAIQLTEDGAWDFQNDYVCVKWGHASDFKSFDLD